MIVTEQYPKGLGKTVSEIDISNARGVYEKTVFSMFTPEVEAELKKEADRRSVVLFGIEVHLILSLHSQQTHSPLPSPDSSVCAANLLGSDCKRL